MKKRNNYIELQCPECGSPLKVWSDETLELHKEKGEWHSYECRNLIRHCNKCHRDWENEWQTENGDVFESPLKRKFWG